MILGLDESKPQASTWHSLVTVVDHLSLIRGRAINFYLLAENRFVLPLRVWGSQSGTTDSSIKSLLIQARRGPQVSSTVIVCHVWSKACGKALPDWSELGPGVMGVTLTNFTTSPLAVRFQQSEIWRHLHHMSPPPRKLCVPTGVIIPLIRCLWFIWNFRPYAATAECLLINLSCTLIQRKLDFGERLLSH